MEDNKSIDFWRSSKLIDEIKEENRADLCEIFGEAVDIVGDLSNAIHFVVVIRGIFFELTQGESATKYPDSLRHACNCIYDNMDDMFLELQDLHHYIALGKKYFSKIDFESDVLELYIKNKIIEFS